MSSASIALAREINNLIKLINEFEAIPENSVWFREVSRALSFLVQAQILSESIPPTCSKRYYSNTKLGNQICGKPLPSHEYEICSACAANGP